MNRIMDFIYNLYGTDHFVLYLTIALVILIILFFIVLFFGKKDQKLEETKKLQKIELENKKKEKVEEKVKEEKEEPVISEKEEPVIKEEQPMVEEIKEEKVEKSAEEITENVNVTIFEPSKEVIKVSKKDVEVPNDIHIDYNEVTESIEKGLSELENIKNAFASINIPTIDDSPVEDKKTTNPKPVETPEKEKTFQPSQVFSSVFVNNDQKEETVEPTIKLEPVVEPEPVVESEPTISINEEPTIMIKPMEIASKEEPKDDFDLPDLKPAEPKIVSKPKVEVAKPVLNKDVTPTNSQESSGTTFSFDDMINETYKLK